MFHKIVGGPLYTNCYIVSDKNKKGFIIDPGFCDDRIKEYIKEEGLDIKCIINTHGHIDHIYGNSMLGYPVYISRADEDYLNDPVKNLSSEFMGMAPKIIPAGFIEEGCDMKIGDMDISFIYTPGHTPGGTCILIDDILFSGDTLFYEGVGRSDLPGGDFRSLDASIKEKLMVLPDNIKVFPGHGPETTIGHEKGYNPFI